MKSKRIIASLIVLLVVASAFMIFILNTNRVPIITGFFGSVEDNQRVQVTFNQKNRYELYLEGKSYASGEYRRSAGHSYVLCSSGNNGGLIVLTNKEIYLSVPSIQDEPFLMSKLSDVPTYFK